MSSLTSTTNNALSTAVDVSGELLATAGDFLDDATSELGAVVPAALTTLRSPWRRRLAGLALFSVVAAAVARIVEQRRKTDKPDDPATKVES